MARPARALISTAAFRHNYLHARGIQPGLKAAAIIKADGYGHGAVRMARAVEDIADAFGVAAIEEALELRDAGIRGPILLLEGCFSANELQLVDRLLMDTVVHSEYQLEDLRQYRSSRPLRVWLKLDSGMHRLGLPPDRVGAAFRALQACDCVGEIILMTHLARADELDCEATAQQLARFKAATAGLEAPHSLANSAATLAWPAARGDWVRPGIMLYGATPLDRPHANDQTLQVTMRLESALIAIRELDAGEDIGYGARFRTAAPTRVGVVAMGYADGYPRHAPDGTPVAVNGIRTRLIGRVSMDMLTVDLTGVPQARIGDPVQLWGDLVSANEVAQASDTIAYQLFTNLSRRVPRIELDNL